MAKPAPYPPATLAAASLQPARDSQVMVLLVDDQALVCEAIRRALVTQPDIDFHYCADAREAINLANHIKP
ncbi:MAG TPA: hypothetical protein VNT26_15540, partial [Candidatus Sulfotelmatobacter sp.]|nr:hypothetical protein [Candidatus Sulfotelmatobacter sp.]